MITLFFYIRIIYSCIMFNYLKLKWFKIFIKNKFISFIMFINLFSIMGLILSTFYFL